ncbi:ScpA family protein [Gallaecimonas kandeliae]|uniref:segregation and condensation protein A n=1 Tax=Gallaecimonas kandeliae TaxID=3029055 RepID=UPI0026479959|nr:ScpA family protein [Gallaecimonas kandeliae]WKE66936.1 ScpA family protein [Gallaecimonas kandeliae]
MTQDTPTQPIQQPLPLAFVHGQPFTELPEDLYIPPQALEVFLEAFEGPLDLLLYLIRRDKVDIVDMPLARITAQYMEYVELMQELKLELAAEYLVMAAILAEIKSRLLLPRRVSEEGEEEVDPRAELIRRLQEYEVMKQAAQDIDALPRVERDTFIAGADTGPGCAPIKLQPEVALEELVLALSGVLKRAAMFEKHQISKEKLSTRERMARVLEILAEAGHLPFVALFTPEEGRSGVVVTFVAILELQKLAAVRIIQPEPLSPIRVEIRHGQDR